MLMKLYQCSTRLEHFHAVFGGFNWVKLMFIYRISTKLVTTCNMNDTLAVILTRVGLRNFLKERHNIKEAEWTPGRSNLTRWKPRKITRSPCTKFFLRVAGEKGAPTQNFPNFRNCPKRVRLRSSYSGCSVYSSPLGLEGKVSHLGGLGR